MISSFSILRAKVKSCFCNVRAKIRDFWRGLQPPPTHELDRYRGPALKWANDFNPADADGSLGEIALEYAIRRLEQLEHDRDQTRAKEDSLLKHLGAIATAEFAAVQLGAVSPNWWFYCSFSLLILGMTLLAYARMTRVADTLPTIASVLEGLQHSKTRKLWLATTIHPVVQAALPTAYWQMRINRLVTVLYIGALMLLLPTIASGPEGADPRDEAAVEEQGAGDLAPAAAGEADRPQWRSRD